MRKIAFHAVLCSLVFATACKKTETVTSDRTLVSPTVILPDGATLPLIIEPGYNYVLQSGKTYYLDGKTYVDDQGTLTIHGGVTIKGIKKNTPAEASALIVTKGGRINALGKADSVIVFTSAEAAPAPGDWGGVIILGRAKNNQSIGSSDPYIDGILLPTVPAGIDVTYGTSGTQYNSESSGIFRYVRILYTGAVIAADNAINGLTLAGVGSGTEINYVQCAYSLDDAFEFWGGTVNASHLVALNPYDDMFDFNYGYTGKLQFVLAVRRSGYSYADANCIESDNDLAGSLAAPRTMPQISNLTSISGSATTALPGTLWGARMRRSTSFQIRNSIFMGTTTGLSLESTATINDAANFAYNILHGFTAAYSGSAILPASNLLIINSQPNSSIWLNSPYTQGLFFRPYPISTNSPAATGADFTGFTAGFFTPVVYKGALPTGSMDWLSGWTVGL